MTPTEKLIRKLQTKFNSGDENLRISENELKLINKNPQAIFLYSKIKMSPYEKGEKNLCRNSYYAKNYLINHKDQIKDHKRIELLENAIAKSTVESFSYADYTGKRFEKGEAAIAKNAEMAYEYAEQIIGGRFELGEAVISKDPQLAHGYANHVIKQRFELGEEAISKNGYWSLKYAECVLKSRFSKGEKAIKKSGDWDEYLAILAEIEFEKAQENKERIKDRKLENIILEEGYCDVRLEDYFKLIKEIIIKNLNNGKILEEYGDLPFLDKAIVSISTNNAIPEEINNYMIAKGLLDPKISKRYFKNKQSFNNKIKEFLQQHKDKTVEEIILSL
jgi:hypothetical protein